MTDTTNIPQIERGSYDILRDRLAAHASVLADRAAALNHKRTEVFGGSETTVLGTERIRTENNCVPRDIVAVGRRLLFGYNVFVGLRSEIKVADVFSLHRLNGSEKGLEFPEIPAGDPDDFLADEAFVRDFRELYQYYKNSKLLQLRRPEGKLLAIFQVGEQIGDIKVFRWTVDREGNVKYIDNRGERDHVFPPRYDFEWTEATRDDQVKGRHPHVSIYDEVFVETIGGDLTIKIENNTEDGLGVYSEPVDDRDQALDDALIRYAKIGSLILLDILPYREQHHRYLVYNRRTRQVRRIDAIGQACVQLPEDQGIIFPGGWYLRSGEMKTFDTNVRGMEFVRMIRSPNGEDVLYVFHERAEGRTLLLPYNVIRKEVVNPLSCHGYSLFDDGRIVIFQALSDEPARVHPMQVWQTPFVSDTHHAQREIGTSYLDKIGNADLVRGIADLYTLRRMVDEQNPTRQLYEDLIAAATRTIDAYYWLGHEEVGNVLEPVLEIRATGELVLDEFDKVSALREHAAKEITETTARFEALERELRVETLGSAQAHVDALAKLRKLRGHVITLREMRYIDRPTLDGIESRVVERTDAIAHAMVAFLGEEHALDPYRDRITSVEEKIPKVEKRSEADGLETELTAVSDSLTLVSDVISGMEIEDATVRIEILERISELMATANRVRAIAANRRRELLQREGVAEFGVQFQLLAQNVSNGIAAASTPEACDEELSKLMLQLENLESRFAEFDEFLGKLQIKREEIYEAFGAKKQTLLDQRQRRAEQLADAAGRMLEGIGRRATTYDSVDDLNAFFSSDPMATRLRETIEKLRALGDSVRADELDGRLRSARDQATRGMRDRTEIFEDGANVIRLGDHRFSVNTRKTELTMVPKHDRMTLHISGTGFYEPVEDPALDATKEFWPQTLVSENETVYRAEYLAYSLLTRGGRGSSPDSRGALSPASSSLASSLLRAGALSESGQEARPPLEARSPISTHAEILKAVRQHAESRYDEGYERGVHDEDAARILAAITPLIESAGLLRFSPATRAVATLFWASHDDRDQKKSWEHQARSLARLRESVATAGQRSTLARALREQITAFAEANALHVSSTELAASGDYLAAEIAREPQQFVLSTSAERLRDLFIKWLRAEGSDRAVADDLRGLGDDVRVRFEVVHSWMHGFVEQLDASERANLEPFLLEAVVAELTDDAISRNRSSAATTTTVEGILGEHPRVVNGKLEIRIDELLSRLAHFSDTTVPAYREYQKLRHAILEKERKRLRTDDLQPRVMSAFVRNKLINDVYLPLIGSNFAKQIGTVGEGKRSDFMGMLLLVSPPGYGKTTLMEYIANRLGLVFMKINGPSLGHSVTSLDPAAAPSSTARLEIERLNLALEMGNNVLLYIDDIQHTNPEFLQKFISLCDAQRRIEGVWGGEPRTYDLRGKRFAVCMAGNPYTESGELFRIPDMLANRADVYNLGDVLEGKDEQFALSFIENALTSNSVTAPLLSRETGDIYKLIRIANGEEVPVDQLDHEYASVELEELLGTLRKLVTVQQLLARVNRQYIVSAAQKDEYRTEPPFKLQGSYRNMNKIAEKIASVMTDRDLEALIDDHYLGEAQTLTTGAEENLLKLAELRGRMDDDQKRRWNDIRQTFARLNRMGGEDDPAARLTGEISIVSDRLSEIVTTIQAAASQRAVLSVENLPVAEAPTKADNGHDTLAPYLDKLTATLETLARLQSEPKSIMIDTDGVKETPAPPPDYQLISKEAYLIKGTLIPLLQFMAHRFRGYQTVDDPKLKTLITKLETVDSLDELVRTLELVNVSALADLTEGKRRPKK